MSGGSLLEGADQGKKTHICNGLWLLVSGNSGPGPFLCAADENESSAFFLESISGFSPDQ
jgi:hypothetical protein